MRPNYDKIRERQARARARKRLRQDYLRKHKTKQMKLWWIKEVRKNERKKIA